MPTAFARHGSGPQARISLAPCQGRPNPGAKKQLRAQSQSIAIVTKLLADLNDALEERYVPLPQGTETEMGLQ